MQCALGDRGCCPDATSLAIEAVADEARIVLKLEVPSRASFGPLRELAVFVLLGDNAYDSGDLREDLETRGTTPVIPNKVNRKEPLPFSKHRYKLRWMVEAAFSRLKDFRRIATHYDRLARNFLASVCLAASLIWWIRESGP